MSVSRDPLLGTGDLGIEFSYGIANFLGHCSRGLHSLQQSGVAQSGPA